MKLMLLIVAFLGPQAVRAWLAPASTLPHCVAMELQVLFGSYIGALALGVFVLQSMDVARAALRVARTPARIGPVVTTKLNERRASDIWYAADDATRDLLKDQKALDLFAGMIDSTPALLLARLSALAPIAAQRGNTTNSNQQIISLNALARAHYRRSIGTRGGAQASAAD
ncbi:hypothetical protein T492DRAFT_856250 [Pavlovales sp. CCMP2436]|nr:hypothetical protein T492DRAFT_856250 [Pavlovales sp. CCMP2436]